MNSKICFCEDENEIINDPTIDAIFVCTPNFRIPELCIAALKAGKHVFSEKPPGFNAEDIQNVIKIVKKLVTRKTYVRFQPSTP